MSTAPVTAKTPIPPPNPVVVGTKPSPADLRAEIDRAETAFKDHLAGLRNEMTLADVNLDGVPLFDRVRSRPLLAIGVSTAVGIAIPVLIGLARRRRPAPDRPAQWWEAYIDDLLNDAAYRVRRGADSTSALQQALRRRAPVIYVEPAPAARASAVRSTTVSAIGTMVNTALGFGLKFAMDRLAQELTGKSEVFEALDEADGEV